MAVLGIVVVGILVLTRKSPEPQVVAMRPGTAPGAAAPGAPAVGTPAAGAVTGKPAGAPPAAGTPAAAVAQNDKGEEAKKRMPKSSAPREHAIKVAKADGLPPAPKAEVAAAAPKPEAPAAPAPKKSGKHDALDDLLNDGSPDSPTKPAKKAAAAHEDSPGGGAGAEDSSLPEQLDKGAIVAGMGKVSGRVRACSDQFHVPGTANVAITISGIRARFGRQRHRSVRRHTDGRLRGQGGQVGRVPALSRLAAVDRLSVRLSLSRSVIAAEALVQRRRGARRKHTRQDVALRVEQLGHRV